MSRSTAIFPCPLSRASSLAMRRFAGHASSKSLSSPSLGTAALGSTHWQLPRKGAGRRLAKRALRLTLGCIDMTLHGCLDGPALIERTGNETTRRPALRWEEKYSF